MPLYLFSGTFFAIEQLPAWLRMVAYLTPLWHGVDLCRTLSLGTATWTGSAIHVGYLLALTAVGLILARRTFRRHLRGEGMTVSLAHLLVLRALLGPAAPAAVDADRQRGVRTVPVPHLDRLRDRPAHHHRSPGFGVCGLRRAGSAGHLGDEQRDQRNHRYGLVPARFERVYEAMLTTPVTVTDIAVGEVASAMLRGAVASSCFFGVIAALGLVHSWWALLAIPATLLIAFAFAGAGLAVATFLRQFSHHQYVQLFMLPMFLFATTFYPLSVYPKPLQAVVACLPLYQEHRIAARPHARPQRAAHRPSPRSTCSPWGSPGSGWPTAASAGCSVALTGQWAVTAGSASSAGPGCLTTGPVDSAGAE